VSVREFYKIATKHYIFAVRLEDINKALEEKPTVDPLPRLLKKYYDLAKLFLVEESNKLPRYRPNNYGIKL